jgi:hypothetical protein
MSAEWLVELMAKEHMGMGMVIGYEEVIATTEFEAKMAGYTQFKMRAKYEPIMRKKLKSKNISVLDVYASCAVKI